MIGGAALALVALVAQIDVADDDGGARWTLAPTLSLALEYDTNATRVPSGKLGSDDVADPAQPPVVGDALVRAESAVAFRSERAGARFGADVAMGAKLFSQVQQERMAVAQGSAFLVAAAPLGFTANTSLWGKARGQQSGARTYETARFDAGVQRALFGPLTARAGLDGTVFHAVDAPVFTSVGDDVSAGVSWFLTSAERLDVGGSAGVRAFPLARPAVGDASTATTGRRLDAPLSAVAAFTSGRRVYVTASYVFERNFSNSRAEAFYRHRLAGLVGFRLPEQILMTTRGAVQLTAYDQGVSLGQRYFLGEDEESQNNVEVMISRPWIGGIVLYGRLFWMGNELAVEGARFSRATASLGARASRW